MTLFPRIDVSDFRDSRSGVTHDAGPGNDLVLGSRFADSFLGSGGEDALFGKRGDDTLRGGADLDAVSGGCGDDTFVFAAGDLITSRARDNGYFGLVDTVLDFHGAGRSGAGEQDAIRLEGFSADASLRFAGHGHTRALQYYEVVDPATPGADGFILVAMADGTRRLTADDVVFVPSNRAPAFAADAFVFALDENNATGAAVGAAAATDPKGGALTYSIVENADGDPDNDVPFAVGAGGAITASAPFDFEAQASYGFTLRATDPGGLSDTAAVTVEVQDVEERTLDLVTANNFADSVSVLLGDGAGGFADAGPDPAVGGEPVSVALGDLDGDGDLDLVAANNLGDSISVLLGDGAGGFADAGPDLAAGDFPAAVALGDLDADGDLDLVATNVLFDDTVGVFLGDGAGGFADTGQDIAVGDDPDSVALGDLDGDGDLDLVTANVFGDSVSVLLGNGAGGFADAGPDPAVGNAPGSVALADLDGDGHLDLVTANIVSSDITVLLGDGTGGFADAGPDPAVGRDPRSMALGDLDGDGDLDLVTANLEDDSVTVLLGDGAGGFADAGTDPAVGDAPLSIALGDLDNDGDLDLVTANATGNSVSILLGDGAGGFADAGPDPAVGLAPVAAALGDLDGPARLTPSGLPDLGPLVPTPAELNSLI